MEEHQAQARRRSVLPRIAEEQLSHPIGSGFSLRRQTQEYHTMNSISSGSGGATDRTPAPGDIIRSSRASEGTRTRLIPTSRPSPLARGAYLASSPDLGDSNQHISMHASFPVSGGANIFRNTEPAAASGVRGVVPQLKTRKSLHQRLDRGSSEELDNSHDLEHREKTHMPHQTQVESSHNLAQSRSGSVVSSIFDRPGQDEDISSIMMRGATDIRNAKFENEEQRREITFLRSQIDVAKGEKEEALHRLKAVKQAAKQSLEASSKSMDSIRASLDGLKVQAEDTFAFASQAKSMLSDIQELKTSAQETIKAVEPLLNENGGLYKVEETKALVTELQLECTKSHQVADLLRERLQSIGAELVEAKSRVTDLENIQAADRDALRVLNKTLSDSTARNNDLGEQLQKKQTDLHQALLAGGEVEAKLVASDEQLEQLKGVIKNKDMVLEQMASVQRENAKLSVLLEERELRILDLHSLQERLDVATATINDYKSRVQVLESQLLDKEQCIADATRKIADEERKLQDMQAQLQRVEGDLGSALAKGDALEKALTSALDEKVALEAEVRDTRDSLVEANKSLEAHSTSFHQVQTKCKVLEERVESQVVSLRIAKDTIGSLQDRLTEAEVQYAREIEAVSGKLNCQIAVLEEQKLVLGVRLTELEATMRATQESGSTVKVEYEDKLSKQEEGYRVQLDMGRERISDAQKTLEDARSTIKSLEEQVTLGRQDILALKDELREAKLPSPAHKETVDALGDQITALREENTELILKARSIDARYRTGDLLEEEKVFINSLVRTSQSAYEQELVTKGNELRHRDNTIKDLQARIHLLETTLAKHLRSQNKANVAAGKDKNSLIDPNAWVRSSEKSSSPQGPVEPSEEDRLSVNVDTTVTAKSTPRPFRSTAPRLPLRTVPSPAPNIPPQHTPAHPLHHACTPTARNTPVPIKKAPAMQYAPDKSSPLVYPTPKAPRISTHKSIKPIMNNVKPTFRRLGTDRSEDIDDFDNTNPQLSPVQDGPELAAGGKVRLGKRDKPTDGKSPSNGRKRLRIGVRTRSVAQQASIGSPIEESPERPAARTRTKKRR